MFDLAYDPALYLDIDVERARALLKSNPRPIRILKANNLPIVRSFHPDADVGVDLAAARERMARIHRHPTFAAMIAQALAGQYDDKEPSPHIEEQIYGGFPGRADSALMERFHQVSWAERHTLSQAFEDERYRQFAERLIYAEYPDGLPVERRTALDQWRREKVSATNEVPWLTLQKAKLELEKIITKAEEGHHGLVAEISELYSQG
jgi:exodeoxyribonuclease-1